MSRDGRGPLQPDTPDFTHEETDPHRRDLGLRRGAVIERTVLLSFAGAPPTELGAPTCNPKTVMWQER